MELDIHEIGHISCCFAWFSHSVLSTGRRNNDDRQQSRNLEYMNRAMPRMIEEEKKKEIKRDNRTTMSTPIDFFP